MIRLNVKLAGWTGGLTSWAHWFGHGGQYVTRLGYWAGNLAQFPRAIWQSVVAHSRLAHESVSAWTCRAKRAVHRRYVPRQTSCKGCWEAASFLWWRRPMGRWYLGQIFLNQAEDHILVHVCISLLFSAALQARVGPWAVHPQPHLRPGMVLGVRSFLKEEMFQRESHISH